MAEKITPRLAKGTRDFGPGEMKLRNHITTTIREVFEIYGFEQIETPAVENLETLTGKYGDEGDKLIFKILNSGDFLKETDPSILDSRNSDKMAPLICEKALRYDLTVPFARYVVQHRNDIIFPFRRFQIQPVWRADRPQKGRYREFYQCDADIIGTDSTIAEGELLVMCGEIFGRLGIKTTIHLNSRKLLLGFCRQFGIEDRFTAFTTILDKMDKKDWAEIENDLRNTGFSEDVIRKTEDLKKKGGMILDEKNLKSLADSGIDNPMWKSGLDDLTGILKYLSAFPKSGNIPVINLTLARGLNYYTGAIIEVTSEEHKIGSLCGGGRYDDLTGIFGMPGLSGIGISFGIDRIFDILSMSAFEEKKLMNRVLLVNFGPELLAYNLHLLSSLRTAGISAELYPESDKLKKQFSYADRKKFDFVIVAGEREMKEGIFSLKNLVSGDQQELKAEEIIGRIKSN